jgi:hypothetical protein
VNRVSALVLVAVCCIGAGCAAPGKVKDYNAQVRTNFVDSCVQADGQDAVADAEGVCGCWYDAIQKNFTFDEFKQINGQLGDAVEAGEIQTAADFRGRFGRFSTVLDQSGCAPIGPR